MAPSLLLSMGMPEILFLVSGIALEQITDLTPNGYTAGESDET